MSETADRRAWWEHPALLLALVLAAAIPLLGPDIPPLVDLPGHIGRYRVQLGLENSPFLGRYYAFSWALIGNLGVDLLIVPLAPLFGIELAAKLVVLAIPPLTVLGFLLVGREVHGHLPPTAFFALPLAYAYPFQFGFVNFALSMALALNAFWLWLRLGRTGRVGLRAALFVPISCLIWLCHTFGWGLLGLLAFAGDTADQRDRLGASRIEAFWKGGLHCLPLALPFLLMIAWRSGGAVQGANTDFFNWEVKGRWLTSLLKERHETWDKAGAVLLLTLPVLAAVRLGFRMRHAFALAAAFLLLMFVLLPRIMFGSAYADMRLAPFMVAVALLGIAPKGWTKRRLSSALAASGLLFFAARLAVTTDTMANIDRRWEEQLAAVERIPAGARVLVQTAVPCSRAWRSDRMEHLGSLAITRRDAYTNDQWAMPGAQLISVHYRAGAPFVEDPSQILRPRYCRGYRETTLPLTMATLPWTAFDYVWFVNLPRAQWPRDERLVPVWTGPGAGILYRLTGSATKASETPNGSSIRPSA